MDFLYLQQSDCGKKLHDSFKKIISRERSHIPPKNGIESMIIFRTSRLVGYVSIPWRVRTSTSFTLKYNPWKINGWNVQITHLERKMIFQTPMIMVHANLPGCILSNSPARNVHWFLRFVSCASHVMLVDRRIQGIGWPMVWNQSWAPLNHTPGTRNYVVSALNRSSHKKTNKCCNYFQHLPYSSNSVGNFAWLCMTLHDFAIFTSFKGVNISLDFLPPWNPPSPSILLLQSAWDRSCCRSFASSFLAYPWVRVSARETVIHT